MTALRSLQMKPCAQMKPRRNAEEVLTDVSVTLKMQINSQYSCSIATFCHYQHMFCVLQNRTHNNDDLSAST